MNRAFSFLKALLIFSHFPPLSSEQLGSRERGRRRSPIALWKPGPEPVGLQVPQEPLPPGPAGGQWSQRALGVSRQDLFQLGGHSRDEVSLCGLRAALVPRHPETPTPTDPHPDSLGPGCRSRNSWLVLPGSELLGARDPSCPLCPWATQVATGWPCGLGLSLVFHLPRDGAMACSPAAPARGLMEGDQLSPRVYMSWPCSPGPRTPPWGPSRTERGSGYTAALPWGAVRSECAAESGPEQKVEGWVATTDP